jgi:hypothetical protein
VTPEHPRYRFTLPSEPAGGDLFINYRGADSRGYCAVLYLELARHFGPERVFLDYMSIPAGADFAEHLVSRVRRASVVLAIIGPDWLGRPGIFRRAAIRSPRDWIRRELAEAFAAGVRVIPVLVDDVELPTERQLPTCLAPLARCQYRRLRVREAVSDVDRIVHELVASDAGLALAAKRRATTPGAAGSARGVTPELADQMVLAAGRAVRQHRDVDLLLDGTRARRRRIPRRPAPWSRLIGWLRSR